MQDAVILVTDNGMGKADLALQQGVRLILCTTCLEYFGLTGKTKVGIEGGMADILEAQVKASQVITI